MQVTGFSLQGRFSSESALRRVATCDPKETTPGGAEDPALGTAIEMTPAKCKQSSRRPQPIAYHPEMPRMQRAIKEHPGSSVLFFFFSNKRVFKYISP